MDDDDSSAEAPQGVVVVIAVDRTSSTSRLASTPLHRVLCWGLTGAPYYRTHKGVGEPRTGKSESPTGVPSFPSTNVTKLKP